MTANEMAMILGGAFCYTATPGGENKWVGKYSADAEIHKDGSANIYSTQFAEATKDSVATAVSTWEKNHDTTLTKCDTMASIPTSTYTSMSTFSGYSLQP